LLAGGQLSLVVQGLGRYSYTDFVRIGLPLNLITWIVGVVVISAFFPF
jgi:di/tricarboxylate transporter